MGVLPVTQSSHISGPERWTIRLRAAPMSRFRGPPIRTRTATSLLPQRQISDRHASICGLAHVIDRQRSDAAGVQGFHLDTCPLNAVHVGLNGDMIITTSKLIDTLAIISG